MADLFQRYIVKKPALRCFHWLLAVGLWLAVARSPLAEVAITVPIELHNFPEKP